MHPQKAEDKSELNPNPKSSEWLKTNTPEIRENIDSSSDETQKFDMSKIKKK